MATRHESTITQWLTDVSGPSDAVDALDLLDRVEHGLFGEGAPRPTVGRYVLGRLLGKGGFGRVYEAEDPQLARRVAVKLVAGCVVRDREAADDFLREGRALARVQHPHCVAIHDVGRYALVGDERHTAEATGIPPAGVYIVMELVRGQPLAAWLAQRSIAEVIAMFEELADALAAAHRVGVIHGDFKPANVAVDERDRGRVLDFGLARLLDPHDRGTSGERGEVAVGTPRYMAYELHCGWPASRASDQFAWAAALCEALGHDLPYAGDTPEDLAASKARGLPPQFGRALPSWLTQLLARAMASEPARRWPDMDAIVTALRRARTRQRRRRFAMAGAALAVGFASLGAAAASGSDACSDADAIATLWNDEQRGAIADAFVASGRPHARTTWSFVERELDEWTHDFAEQHERVCRSQARVEPLRCLDEQRWRLAGVLGVLRDGDAGNVDDAHTVLAALPDPARCTALGESRPVEPEGIVEQYADVAAAVSLVAAGRTSEARERTDALQRDGRLAPGPAAEAWLVEARVSLLDGDPSAADTALANILALASEHGLPAAETIALACRARTRWEMGDPGGALAFAELARTRLASAQDDPDTLLVAELCLAVHAEERGEGETALTSYARLRELAAARYGADHPTALVHARRHAQSLYRLQRYEDAETALGDIDLGLAQSLGRDHPATLDAEMLRALVDAEIGDGAAAMAAMIDVHARYARVVGPDHIMVATALHNLAVLHMRAHRAAHALGPARRAHAVRLAKLGAHHRATLETASPLAIAMDATGDRPGAIAFLEQAIASAAPALGEQHPVLLRVQAVLLQFEVCEEHEAARRVDEARELVARIRAHAPIPAAERPAQHALAIASRAAGRYDESLRIRRELHSAGCPTGRDDTRVCHGSAFQLARAQLDAGETEALADATRALDEYARDPGATLRDVSMMHLALADTLEHTGRLGEAAREYEAALPGMVVGGASRLGRGAIAWGAARMLARSSEQQRALLDIARAAFVAEHASESVAEIDAWLESRR